MDFIAYVIGIGIIGAIAWKLWPSIRSKINSVRATYKDFY